MTQYDLPPTKAARGFQGYAAGRAISRLIAPTLRRRGFRQLPILERWQEIVGKEIAAFSRPERITRRGQEGATLIIRVEGAMAVELQHMTPLIIERLNVHFGGAAITQIKIMQGHLPLPPLARQARPLEQAEITAIEQALPPLKNSKLRHALARLGAYVYRDNRDDNMGDNRDDN